MGQIPAWYTNMEACDYLMENCVAIHLDTPAEKFNIVGVMLKKLFSLVQKKCVVEGVDALMMHEIVLGGHLYLQLLKAEYVSISLRRGRGKGYTLSLTSK
jgi:DNA-directed RNA polymerase I subunit RPA2